MTHIMDRATFTTYLRGYRAARQIKTYGRLAQFGRIFITFDGVRVACPDYTRKPPMNLHRSEGGR